MTQSFHCQNCASTEEGELRNDVSVFVHSVLQQRWLDMGRSIGLRRLMKNTAFTHEVLTYKDLKLALQQCDLSTRSHLVFLILFYEEVLLRDHMFGTSHKDAIMSYISATHLGSQPPSLEMDHLGSLHTKILNQKRRKFMKSVMPDDKSVALESTHCERTPANCKREKHEHFLKTNTGPKQGISEMVRH